MGKSAQKLYAVANGRKTGIFSTWEECKASVHKFTGAKFKSFKTRDLAEAYLLGASSKAAMPKPSIATKRNADSVGTASQDTSNETTAVLDTRLRKKIKSEMMNPTERRKWKIHIMFDGGARGNPGIAGAGAMVALSTSDHTDTEIRHVRYYVGNNATNNVAEYSGLLYGLYMAQQMVQATEERSGELIVQGDSNLIIQQLNGKFKVKNANLKPLFQQVQDKLEALKECGLDRQVFEHVYRNANQVADGLANEAMDAQRSWFTTNKDQHTEQFPVNDVLYLFSQL